MNTYERLKADLAERGTGTMKCFGSSRLPILANPSIDTFRRQDDYAVGDIVFCTVNGFHSDAHKITRKGDDGRYLISTIRGHDNGWTRTIYGRVVRSIDGDGTVRTFRTSARSIRGGAYSRAPPKAPGAAIGRDGLSRRTITRTARPIARRRRLHRPASAPVP